MPFPAGFDLGSFDRIGLQELIEVFLGTPPTVVVVETELTRFGIGNDWVFPFGQFDAEPRLR